MTCLYTRRCPLYPRYIHTHCTRRSPNPTNQPARPYVLYQPRNTARTSVQHQICPKRVLNAHGYVTRSGERCRAVIHGAACDVWFSACVFVVFSAAWFLSVTCALSCNRSAARTLPYLSQPKTQNVNHSKNAGHFHALSEPSEQKTSKQHPQAEIGTIPSGSARRISPRRPSSAASLPVFGPVAGTEHLSAPSAVRLSSALLAETTRLPMLADCSCIPAGRDQGAPRRINKPIPTPDDSGRPGPSPHPRIVSSFAR